MMKRTVFAMLAAAVFASSVFSQHSGAGTKAFPFLNLDYDSRTLAMGGACVAMPNDLYGVAVNPAAVGYITKRQVVAGYRSVVEDLWGGPIGFAMPYSTLGTFAINLVNISYGSLNEIIEGPDGGPLETNRKWNGYALAGSVSWAKLVWEDLSLGISARGVHDYYGTTGEHISADAIALQAGMQYRWLADRIITGIALNNAGFMVAGYTDYTEDLKMPFSVSAGVSYVPFYLANARIALDLQQPSDGYLTYKLGGELAIYKKYLFVRAGYSWSEPDLEAQIKVLRGEASEGYQKTNWSGPSFGIGVNSDFGMINANVDAAVQLIEDADPAFGLSLLVSY
jgi:hypothetical protein